MHPPDSEEHGLDDALGDGPHLRAHDESERAAELLADYSVGGPGKSAMILDLLLLHSRAKCNMQFPFTEIYHICLIWAWVINPSLLCRGTGLDDNQNPRVFGFA